MVSWRSIILVSSALPQRFQAKPGIWVFLTGPREALRHLSRESLLRERF